MTSGTRGATPAMNAIAEATKAMQDGTTRLLGSTQEHHTSIILLLKAAVQELRTPNARLSNPRLDRQGTWSVRTKRVLAHRVSCSLALWASCGCAM
jgi:hypothetical protein